MSVLTQDDRLVVTSSMRLPRVNLLPPEIAEKAAFRKVQVGLAAAALTAVGVTALLYVSAAHGVSTAQGDLDGATAQNTNLQRQSAQYANVTAVYNQAAAAQATLTSAMGDEIRWSQMLNDLSLTIPSNVWLSNLAYTSGGAAAAPGTAAAPGSAAVGNFTATATAFSHDDVAVWLESIAGLKTYANPYFTTSAESLLGRRKVVTFTTTAAVTPAALSGRYTKPLGG